MTQLKNKRLGEKKLENQRHLAGKLLLAMPSMGDPRFHRAVILVCAHDESGAMGLVINHALPGIQFSELLKQFNITSDIKIRHSRIPVLSGGPVEGARGFILHSSEFRQKDTISINQQYSITGTIEALKDVARGQGPEQMLFILGYAGWEAEQLDREIQENAWLVADPDPDLIFNADPQDKWARAVRKLGIEPGMLSTEAGHA